MGKKTRVVNVTSRNGKLFAVGKDSDEETEPKNKLVDAYSWISQKKDAYGFGMMGLGIFGIMILQALFIGLFSYFWYGQDVNLMLGFIGYLVTIDILSFVIIIPVLGTVIAFIEFFYWDAQILAFFGIPDDCLTFTIKIFFLISMIVGNVIVSILVVYWRMNKEVLETESKWKLQEVIKALKETGATQFQNLDGAIAYRKSDKMVYKLLIWSGIVSGIVLILIPIVTMIYNQIYILNITEIYMLVIGVILLLVGLTILVLWKTRSKKIEENKPEIKETSKKAK